MINRLVLIEQISTVIENSKHSIYLFELELSSNLIYPVTNTFIQVLFLVCEWMYETQGSVS